MKNEEITCRMKTIECWSDGETVGGNKNIDYNYSTKRKKTLCHNKIEGTQSQLIFKKANRIELRKTEQY